MDVQVDFLQVDITASGNLLDAAMPFSTDVVTNNLPIPGGGSKMKWALETAISMKQICRSLGKVQWFPIYNVAKGGATNAAAHGSEIGLSFSLTGPGSSLCPSCGLFLSESSVMMYNKERYHASCVYCHGCDAQLKEDGFFYRNQRFYCPRHYEVEFGRKALIRAKKQNIRPSFLVPACLPFSSLSRSSLSFLTLQNPLDLIHL